MEFSVSQDVLDVGVRIRGVFIQDIEQNTEYSKELNEYIDAKIQSLLTNTTREGIKEDSIIQGFYELHQRVNVPRRKNPPASENLLLTLVKKQSLFHINPIVDIYNLISMESKLALGAHDIDRADGNIHLRLTDGSETFIPLGQQVNKGVAKGVYSYIDDSNEVLCYLEIRQVDKTKITNDSQNIFYIVQGNQNTSQEYIDKIAQEIINVTTHFCGGKGILLEHLI